MCIVLMSGTVAAAIRARELQGRTKDAKTLGEKIVYRKDKLYSGLVPCNRQNIIIYDIDR